MGIYYTPGWDTTSDVRRAHLARLQSRLRRRLYWGPDGLAWAPVRLASYVVIIVAVSVIVTVVLAR